MNICMLGNIYTVYYYILVDEVSFDDVSIDDNDIDDESVDIACQIDDVSGRRRIDRRRIGRLQGNRLRVTNPADMAIMVNRSHTPT